MYPSLYLANFCRRFVNARSIHLVVKKKKFFFFGKENLIDFIEMAHFISCSPILANSSMVYEFIQNYFRKSFSSFVYVFHLSLVHCVRVDHNPIFHNHDKIIASWKWSQKIHPNSNVKIRLDSTECIFRIYVQLDHTLSLSFIICFFFRSLRFIFFSL